MKLYKKNSKIGRTKLTKSDLSELVALINDGIISYGRKEDLEITADLYNLKINEYDLDAFLRHTELPMILDFIVIKRIGWLDPHTSTVIKIVNLLLGTSASELTVAGQDQAWVLGKHAQLTNYIKSKRTFLWFISMEVSYIIIGMIIVAFTFIVGAAIGMTIASHKINPLFPLAILPLLLLFYTLSKMKNTTIVLQEKESFLNKYGTIIAIVLSFMTLLATVVIGIIQINNK